MYIYASDDVGRYCEHCLESSQFDEESLILANIATLYSREIQINPPEHSQKVV